MIQAMTIEPSKSAYFDARDRQLHLLPALQTDPYDHVEATAIALEVTASWTDDSLTPKEGVKIRQPYPNPLYFVAGSNECHLGWFVALPNDVSEGQLTFHWQVSAPQIPPGHIEVRHVLDLSFESGEGCTWSMDIANYWDKSEFAQCNKLSEIGHNRFSRMRGLGISHRREAEVIEGLREGKGKGKGSEVDRTRHVEIRESLSLPAIYLEECWTVNRYGGPLASRVMENIRRG